MVNIIHTDKQFIVYCHTNKLNGKRYIGITCQEPNQRFRNGNGYKSNQHFFSAIMKYGWDNFTHEILFTNLTQKEAMEREVELIAKYGTRDSRFGYNATPGGEICCGENNPWYGKHHTEEARKKMSEQRIGVPKTDAWKMLMSKKLKGRSFSKETKKKMSENHCDVSGERNPCFGRKLSQEHIKKMVEASKTDEAIAKMKQNKVWYSGGDNPNAKRVTCIETGITYDTVNDAAKENGCTPSKVSAVCNGHRKSTNNLHFKFAEE